MTRRCFLERYMAPNIKEGIRFIDFLTSRVAAHWLSVGPDSFLPYVEPHQATPIDSYEIVSRPSKLSQLQISGSSQRT